jgi:adenylosuccinate synthase
VSDIIPDYAPEAAIVTGRRRMPGWAIALATALAATCAGATGIVLTIQYQDTYRTDQYKHCIATNRANVKLLDALHKLRDADAAILAHAEAGNFPVTDFGRIDLQGIKQRVEAYDELLSEVPTKQPSCD